MQFFEQESHIVNKIFATDNINTQVNILTNTFNNCLNYCAPLVTKELKRPFAPWINGHLRALMHERNTTQINLKNDRSNVDLQLKYSRLKKEVKKSINQTRSEYYSNKFGANKRNSAATWSVLIQIISTDKCKVPMELNNDEGTVRNKVKVFNNFFANVGKHTFEKTQQSRKDNQNAHIPNINNTSNQFSMY